MARILRQRQINKMVEISRQLEDTEYGYRSRDLAETDFLRTRESDLLFQHGFSYAASRDLDCSRAQVEKSLRDIQKQMERELVQEQQRSKQMEMGL